MACADISAAHLWIYGRLICARTPQRCRRWLCSIVFISASKEDDSKCNWSVLYALHIPWKVQLTSAAMGEWRKKETFWSAISKNLPNTAADARRKMKDIKTNSIKGSNWGRKKRSKNKCRGLVKIAGNLLLSLELSQDTTALACLTHRGEGFGVIELKIENDYLNFRWPEIVAVAVQNMDDTSTLYVQ